MTLTLAGTGCSASHWLFVLFEVGGPSVTSDGPEVLYWSDMPLYVEPVDDWTLQTDKNIIFSHAPQ